ncbi:MAG: alanine/glycine:cation symporter family protein, partial [Pseudomonadota bacterium]|nr:alanine/glycine:cation symporter family protein [Pseudomonadota bacterium]
GVRGDITHFQALSTALSATVGTGNIAGGATAISLGGPGAVFWMWVTAVVGMATKFTSCTLALHYRDTLPNGSVAGGPMYTLRNGLGMPRLAATFAVFTLIASFGIGNMVQANSVVDGLRYLHPAIAEASVLVGFILAGAVALVILGGIRSIARVASVIVPFMAIAYCSGAVIILLLNAAKIPEAFVTIFNLALNPAAAGGGAIGAAIQYGVARGVFSNEAGLGSSPIAHAAAATNEPVREGLVAMMEPFIDTLCICTLTALVIVIGGYWGDARPEGLAGAALSAHAFSAVLGTPGAIIVGGGLVFFAFSTIIAWSYYGDRCALFLFGPAAVLPYRLLYVAMVVVGASVPLTLVWNFADIANVLMFVPNIISLLLLTGVAVSLKQNYFQSHRKRDTI